MLDEVLIGVDEDANLAWAVELRADGVQLLRDAETAAAIAETTRTGTRAFRYLPSTTLPNGWHPYQRVRARRSAADGGVVTAATIPAPATAAPAAGGRACLPISPGRIRGRVPGRRRA